MPRLSLLLTFFKPEASMTAADALRRLLGPRRELDQRRVSCHQDAGLLLFLSIRVTRNYLR
jgi:hypothetical protein